MTLSNDELEKAFHHLEIEMLHFKNNVVKNVSELITFQKSLNDVKNGNFTTLKQLKKQLGLE